MSPKLTFKVQMDYQIDPSKNKPINESKRLANEKKVTHLLTPYIDKINLCGGYILVIFGQDGETIYENRLKNCSNEMFNLIMDVLHAE